RSSPPRSRTTRRHPKTIRLQAMGARVAILAPVVGVVADSTVAVRGAIWRPRLPDRFPFGLNLRHPLRLNAVGFCARYASSPSPPALVPRPRLDRGGAGPEGQPLLRSQRVGEDEPAGSDALPLPVEELPHHDGRPRRAARGAFSGGGGGLRGGASGGAHRQAGVRPGGGEAALPERIAAGAPGRGGRPVSRRGPLAGGLRPDGGRPGRTAALPRRHVEPGPPGLPRRPDQVSPRAQAAERAAP